MSPEKRLQRGIELLNSTKSRKQHYEKQLKNRIGNNFLLTD